MARLIRSESKFPLLITNYGNLLYVPTRWLLNLKRGLKDLKYIDDLAHRLKYWLNYLESRDVPMEEAITQDFTEYRDLMLNEGRVEKATINLYLGAPVEFYWWAQREGFFRPMVGWADFERPEVQYQIKVNKPRVQSAEYEIPWLVRARKNTQPKVLTADQVRELRIAVSRRTKQVRNQDVEAIDTRNQLILRWLTEGALRRAEVAGLKVSSIPPRSNKQTMVDVVIAHGTKFDKSRTIKVSPNLIAATHDFIEFERGQLIHRSIQEGGPDVVFPSTNKKGDLNPDTVGKMISNTGLGIKTHDLRSYGLYRYACHLYKIERMLVGNGDKKRVDVAMVEMKLKQQAGHSTFNTTIKHYVNMAALATASDESFSELEEEERYLRDRLAMIESEKERAQNGNLPI